MGNIAKQRKEELARMDLPSDEEMRGRIRRFLLLSGLTANDFAHMVEYNGGIVSRFLSGQYEHDSSAFKCAAKTLMDSLEYSSSQRLDKPHYHTADYLKVRTAAWNALRNGTAYIVDGPPGTQKTESFRRIEQEINRSGEGRVVYVYCRASHAPRAFLAECCASAGLPSNGNIDPLIRKLRFFLGRERVLLMVDEAQHLGFEGLEVLRQLLDLPPHFGVMLGGSDNLSVRLRHWTMEQWRSRVRQTIEMRGPSDAECRTILRAALGQDLSDAECAQTIAECKARGERVEMRGGKEVRTAFNYTSARVLFGAIEHALQPPVPAPAAAPVAIPVSIPAQPIHAIDQPEQESAA